MTAVTGGSRSGKSVFAEQLAGQYGEHILYIATAPFIDEEMKLRIKKHQERRKATWDTYEGFQNLATVIQENYYRYDGILLDSLTSLVTGFLFSFLKADVFTPAEAQEAEQKITEEITLLAMESRGKKIAIVMEETGMGIVPETPLTRLFRDISGKANQIVAKEAEKVYFIVSGISVQIK